LYISPRPERTRSPAFPDRNRLIVLVTMVSLLLELVMIRWLASVFPVFSFFKNFTLLACFLGLGAGYAVSDTVILRNPMKLGITLILACLARAFSFRKHLGFWGR